MSYYNQKDTSNSVTNTIFFDFAEVSRDGGLGAAGGSGCTVLRVGDGGWWKCGD